MTGGIEPKCTFDDYVLRDLLKLIRTGYFVSLGRDGQYKWIPAVFTQIGAKLKGALDAATHPHWGEMIGNH